MTKKTKRVTEGVAFLIENELEKAELVLAAKAVLDKLQGMAEDLATVEADDIMPMLDSMKTAFGPEVAERFNQSTTQALRTAVEALKSTKDAISTEVAHMEGGVTGAGANDMAMDVGMEPEAGIGEPELDPEIGEMPAPAPEGEGDIPPEAEMADDIDLELGDDGVSAAGRPKKESAVRRGNRLVEGNIAKLKAARSPDRLIVETFRRALREGSSATAAAKKTARAFAIDLGDVVEIVQETVKGTRKALKEDAGGQQVQVIYINTGHGENLAQISKDESRKHMVQVVSTDFSSGRPRIKFQDGGDTYYANWTDGVGFVADFD